MKKFLQLSSQKKASALIVSIFVTVVIIIIAIYLLDKIVPFSRDIKGIENGNIAYYRANTAVNEALLSMSGATPEYETGANTVANGSGMAFYVTATGKILPPVGKGNSEYDKDWSILAPGRPVQLVLPITITDWSNIYFIFRVPKLDGTSPGVLSGAGPIINWVLSTSGESLLASGSQIMVNKINGSAIIFNDGNGLTLSGSAEKFEAFYARLCASTKCTLKLSLINPLSLSTPANTTAPYLEYQAYFNVPVALQTATVETSGYAGGFRQNITRNIQQMTTNESLDFTVFQ